MTKTRKYLIGGAAALAFTAAAGAAWAAQHRGDTTRAEAQTRAGEMFTRMDGNRDGKLDQADRTAHQTRMFDAVDANRDGTITREEFAAHRPGVGERGERRERRGHGERMGGRHGMMGGGAMLLAQADSNRDSAVSQAEFTAAALAHFDRADTDRNGTLTRAERRAAHEAMRAQLRQVAPPATPAQPATPAPAGT